MSAAGVLHGAGTALVTPFARDGSIDERALRDLVDWQIAEGGSEGPRKLQAYLPLTRDYERRWRHDAITELKMFLDRSPTALDVVDQARARAETLLQELQPQ